MHPYGIKQQPFVRVDTPVKFDIKSSKPLRYQFIPRLEQHLRLCDQAQKEYPWKQIAVQTFILRPSRGTDCFVEKAWSSSKHTLLPMICLHAACMLPACFLHATCTLLACRLHAASMQPACHHEKLKLKTRARADLDPC